jgi:hypothetical protein
MNESKIVDRTAVARENPRRDYSIQRIGPPNATFQNQIKNLDHRENYYEFLPK